MEKTFLVLKQHKYLPSVLMVTKTCFQSILCKTKMYIPLTSVKYVSISRKVARGSYRI